MHDPLLHVFDSSAQKEATSHLPLEHCPRHTQLPKSVAPNSKLLCLAQSLRSVWSAQPVPP